MRLRRSADSVQIVDIRKEDIPVLSRMFSANMDGSKEQRRDILSLAVDLDDAENDMSSDGWFPRD